MNGALPQESNARLSDSLAPRQVTLRRREWSESATTPYPADSPKGKLFDAAYTAYCERLEAGENIDLDVYCQQFPTIQSSLRRILRAHELLKALPLEGVPPLPPPPPKKLTPDEDVCWPILGEDFGDFRVMLELGRGTFARVYLASEPKVGGRLVAIKIAQGGGLEAEFLGRINHPNIVPILSVQENRAADLTVICMPYLGSATLEHVVDQVRFPVQADASARIFLEVAGAVLLPPDAPPGPRPPEPILHHGLYLDGVRWLGMRLADALAHIHQRDICHLDLKPSNILLSPEGVPMLLDFNLARAPMVCNDQIGGTLAYMPPEQLLAIDETGVADLSELDARSDLFALGVILYELLTGQSPFLVATKGLSNQEACQLLLKTQRQAQGRVNLRAKCPWVDPSFAQLIERCLAYDPKDRPQSATEVSARLRQGLTPVSRTRRWIGRRPRLLIAATLLLLALSGAGVNAWQARPPYSQRQIEISRDHVRQGRYSQAVQHFSLALEAEPTLAAAWFGRARAYQQMGATDKEFYHAALSDYLAAEKLAPDAKNLLGTADCLTQLGNYRGAIGYYELALQEPRCATAEAHNNLGYCFLKINRLDEAEANFDAALKWNPRLATAYYNRSCLVLLRMQEDLPLQSGATSTVDPISKDLAKANARRLQQGIADIQQALKLGPATGDLHFQAACLYRLAASTDDRMKKSALIHLQESIQRGLEPQRILSDRFFLPLYNSPEFEALTKTVRPLQPSETTPKMLTSLQD